MSTFIELVVRGDGDDWFPADLDGSENPYYVCAQFADGSRIPLPIILNDPNADRAAAGACEAYEDAAVAGGHWTSPEHWNSRRIVGDPSNYGRCIVYI